ncbi:hypothetical protein CLAIMM_10407 isoform 2, partial [Cladophialophora immunda]
MLGGTSASNQSLWMRGTRADYDELAAMVGSDEWSWDGLLPYFQKHERLNAQDAPLYPSDTHGTAGLIHTSANRSQVPIEKDFLETCREVAGFDATSDDPTTANRDNFFNALSTVDRSERPGTRSYSASAYIASNLGRANLKILTGATVESVRFDTSDHDPTADGVHFWHGGKRYTAAAKREVIICAGTYKTPQILELSGIGDPGVLRAAGVDCLIANKLVGANLQDHHAVAISFELAPGGFSIDAFVTPEVVKPLMELYQKTGTGPLANPPSGMGYLSYAALAGPEELQATLDAVASAKGIEAPLSDAQQQRVIKKLQDRHAAAIQLLFIPASINTEKGLTDQSQFLAPLSTETNHVSVVAASQYPLSRGSVHITGRDAQAPPAIDNAFLAHPADVA